MPNRSRGRHTSASADGKTGPQPARRLPRSARARRRMPLDRERGPGLQAGSRAGMHGTMIDTYHAHASISRLASIASATAFSTAARCAGERATQSSLAACAASSASSMSAAPECATSQKGLAGRRRGVLPVRVGGRRHPLPADEVLVLIVQLDGAAQPSRRLVGPVGLLDRHRLLLALHLYPGRWRRCLRCLHNLPPAQYADIRARPPAIYVVGGGRSAESVTHS